MGIFFLLFTIPFATSALYTSGPGAWLLYAIVTPFFAVFPIATFGAAGAVVPLLWLIGSRYCGGESIAAARGPATLADSARAAAAAGGARVHGRLRRRSRRRRFGGGGFGGGGFGGGGFSGGGGSFGGGGASGPLVSRGLTGDAADGGRATAPLIPSTGPRVDAPRALARTSGRPSLDRP
jgi:hypothetical protein